MTEEEKEALRLKEAQAQADADAAASSLEDEGQESFSASDIEEIALKLKVGKIVMGLKSIKETLEAQVVALEERVELQSKRLEEMGDFMADAEHALAASQAFPVIKEKATRAPALAYESMLSELHAAALPPVARREGGIVTAPTAANVPDAKRIPSIATKKLGKSASYNELEASSASFFDDLLSGNATL